ncbi:MAG: hypothetical protein ACOZCO_07090 [Bacteroidota bacterium]
MKIPFWKGAGYLFVLSSCSSGYSDMKEFGFRDNPQTIITKIYDGPVIINGQWAPRDENEYNSLMEMRVNPQGMVTEIISRNRSEEGVMEENRTVYSFQDGRKSSGEIYDDNGSIVEYFTCHWVEDRICEIHGFDRNGVLKFTQKNFLDEEYRDVSGDYILYSKKNGEIIFNEIYRNEYNADGIMTVSESEHKTKSETGRFISYRIKVRYEIISQDEKRNVTSALIYEDESEVPSRLLVRKIYYHHQ